MNFSIGPMPLDPNDCDFCDWEFLNGLYEDDEAIKKQQLLMLALSQNNLQYERKSVLFRKRWDSEHLVKNISRMVCNVIKHIINCYTLIFKA